MSSSWQQLLAALIAAVVPVLVKLANDWHDKLTQQPAQPTAPDPSPATAPDTEAGH